MKDKRINVDRMTTTNMPDYTYEILSQNKFTSKEVNKILNDNEKWYDNLKVENEQLKQQIDKAIKYIDETTTAFTNFTKVECGLNLKQTKELLSILKGTE